MSPRPSIAVSAAPGYKVEPTSERVRAVCTCCGNPTRRVWGFVHLRDGDTRAAYFVTWTPGRPDHGAEVDLALGPWGNSASPADRIAVAVDCRLDEQGPEFMVVDTPPDSPAAGVNVAGRALKRDEVVGTALAGEVFGLIDALWVQDGRLAEVAGPAG